MTKRSLANPGVRAAVLALLIAFASLAGGSRVTEAHAALVRSSPSSQAQLSAAPGSIDLWFSEPLEPKFSTFELLAIDGRALSVSGIRVDPADPSHLSGLPERLAPGLYTIAYRNLSTQDGHEWTGTFAFTVLNPDGSVPSGEAFAPERGGGRASPERVVGRWLGFSGWSLVMGSVLVFLIATRSAHSDLIVRSAAGRIARGLTFAAIPLLAVSGGLELSAQVSALEVPALDVLSGTRFGTLWLWRQLAVLGLAACVALAAVAAGRHRHRFHIAALSIAGAVAMAALLTVSLISHAAAAPGFGWAVITDFSHLAVAATWVGGLGALFAVLARLRTYTSAKRESSVRSAVVLGLVAPFSFFAASAVLVLSVTGVVRSLGELPTLGALTETAYGRWLLVKIALILPLLGVGWLNRQTLQRALRGGRRTEIAATQRLMRTLPLEALLGVGVLALVAVLGQTPTARGTDTSRPVSSTQAYTNIQTAADLSMHLQVSPASVGANELRVHVYPTEGGDLSAVRVFFTFSAAGRLGGERVEAKPSGGGLYTSAGDFLSIADTWNVRVDILRAEGDVTSTFAVPIGPSSAATVKSPWSSPAPQLPSMTLIGVLLIAVGAAALGARQLRRSARGGAIAAGGLLVFVGLWLSVSGGITRNVGDANPIPINEESIALGSTLYAANCASCHGSVGRGDGPLAAELRPPPADLRTHVPLHPEGDIYSFVANGFPRSSMPAWKDKLTNEEIWYLVNFLRAGLTP